MSVTVKNLLCTGCGAPLTVPKKSSGYLKCSSCDTECVLDGIVKNAEIAAKENINSGVPIAASPAIHHKILVSTIAQSPHMPIDAFEEIEVLREERYCVPAYYYHCTGTASYTYEVGMQRTQVYTANNQGKTELKEKIVTEWSPCSSSTSVSLGILAPGNKELTAQTKLLYSSLEPKMLVDIEELDFPPDVETYDYNIPQLAVYSEYVAPNVDQSLKDKINASLAKQNVRNLVIGGSNIQKEIIRVFLGLTNVIYAYKGREYSVWINGDGGKAFHDRIPEDLNRQLKLDAMKKEYKDLCNRHSSIYSEETILSIITLSIYYFMNDIATKRNYREAERKKKADEIKQFESALVNVKHEFISQNKTLRGLYAANA